MGSCVGKPNKEDRYLAQSTPNKQPTRSRLVEASIDLPPPYEPHPDSTDQKENIDLNLPLNLQSTVEIKRKPTEGESERKATLKSGVRSLRSSEAQPIDQRVQRMMEKDALLAEIYLKVRQNLKRQGKQ